MEENINNPAYKNRRDLFIAFSELSKELSEDLRRYGMSEDGSRAIEKFQRVNTQLQRALNLLQNDERRADEYIGALRRDWLVGVYLK